MLLDKLEIERKKWGDNAGTLTGSAKFIADTGSVTVRLDDAAATKILLLCAESIVHEAKAVAEAMVVPVIEASKQLEKAPRHG